jgi:hypothetical protein
MTRFIASMDMKCDKCGEVIKAGTKAIIIEAHTEEGYCYSSTQHRDCVEKGD